MNFIQQNWESIILVVIGPILTWFFIKRPDLNRDLKSKDIQNDASSTSVIGQNLDLYQRMLDDVEARANDKFIKLYLEIDVLEKENTELRARIKKLEER